MFIWMVRVAGDRRRQLPPAPTWQAVLDAVMLGEHDDVQPEAVGPRALIETGGVLGMRRGRDGRTCIGIEIQPWQCGGRMAR